MHTYNKKAKENARVLLNGNYSRFISAILLWFLLSSLILGIPSMLYQTADNPWLLVSQYLISFMLNVLVHMLYVGISRMSMTLVKRHTPHLGELFFAFRNQAENFLVISLLLTGIQTVLQLPFSIAGHLHLLDDLSLPLYYAIYFGSTALAFLIYIFLTVSLSLAEFVLLDRPELSPREAIAQSRSLIRGHRMQYLSLVFSFLGLLLMGCLSLGIGLLWVVPYIRTCYASFYYDCKHGSF